jgi:polysaccharide export outer membrane protein
MTKQKFFRQMMAVLSLFMITVYTSAFAQTPKQDYQLGAGDIVKITVFQNPDLTIETRVGESGSITFPLIGEVKVGGLTTPAVERLIAQRLREGGFVQQPQVNVAITQFKSTQVSVLGQVNKPGRYPVEGTMQKVTDLLALAGGVMPSGGDVVTLVTTRSGKEERIEIDLARMFLTGDMSKDMVVANGDLIYVPRAPVYYINGEVQHPGQFRLERDMTVQQALATGGGLTLRGTVRGIKLNRRDESGELKVLQPKMADLVRPDDVIFVQESLF